MSETKPYYVPSTASSKSTTKRSNNVQQTNYETLLSHFNNKNVSKLAKATSGIQCDKFYIQSLQQQIVELKEQVNYLSEENKRLLQIQDRSLIKIKHQYVQLTKFSNLLQIIQQLKIENAALRQNVESLKLDFKIQILPLKQLFNHIISIPKMNDIMQMRVEQQECQISQLKNKCEILNIERTNLLETVYKHEEDLISTKKQLLNK